MAVNHTAGSITLMTTADRVSSHHQHERIKHKVHMTILTKQASYSC